MVAVVTSDEPQQNAGYIHDYLSSLGAQHAHVGGRSAYALAYAAGVGVIAECYNPSDRCSASFTLGVPSGTLA